MDRFHPNGSKPKLRAFSLDDDKAIRYINIKLAALGQPIFGSEEDFPSILNAMPILKNFQERNRFLLDYYCPSDRRIQNFLDDYLKDVPQKISIKLPSNTFVLDRAGLARVMSLPPDRDQFISNIVESYRVKQGILHNPQNDRRTTQDSFHITEGGLSIPDDKLAVPKATFAALLGHALTPPDDLQQIPFTGSQEKKAKSFVSLYMRPITFPEAGEHFPLKTMEIRFFAPGNLVSNLDFVETIFGNAGDPYLPANDAALDVEHWSGHTGCIIIAPHLVHLKKKDLGLPPVKEATERQKRDGMCYTDENELYNLGRAFKVTCRDERGIMVTLIADNYFGYSKKEVKTQISFAANLFGLSEEEHSGGAIAYPTFVLGQDFSVADSLIEKKNTFADVLRLSGPVIEAKPEGYAVDKRDPRIVYVPENSKFNAGQSTITWQNGKKEKIKLLAEKTYILPSGYRIHLEKQAGGRVFRLIGTAPEGTLCHKPCTVSGGGKSEISKPIAYSAIQGPVFIKDYHKDFDEVEQILKKDFTHIYKNNASEEAQRSHRPVLSPERTLGSVIKLFTTSSEYVDEHNEWLKKLPNTLRQLIFLIKRYHQPEWEDNWRQHFSVDEINGAPGHELKFDNQKLVANYLRVGANKDGSWRIFKTRPDYHWAEKVQVEDDITISVVVPREWVEPLNPEYTNPSVKLVLNCESYLFQRPDDCVYRGYDKQAEADLATPNTFLSNFEPLKLKDAKDIIEKANEFDQYSDPMRNLIANFAEDKKPTFFVSSAHPRMVEGKPSKNPRYLQKRPDVVNAHGTFCSEVSARLYRGIAYDKPLYFPVNAVLPGRRNNPPNAKAGVPALAVFNPIHFQDLPELFMDFICSVTGKSPSTTGFGTEGALTKGPFNALWPVVDLNNALVSYIMTGYQGFSSAAGHVGPHYKVDHDISLLIPEIWCRMKVAERDPQFLIKNGYLEKIEDFTHKGQSILASRLGFRITLRFCETFLGRIFEYPNMVFNEDMLKPEKQNLDMYVEGIRNIEISQARVAENYFKDGSIEAAIPPLKALLHIMAKGSYEGKGLNDPSIRAMFTRDYVLKSDWYKERLETKQKRSISLWTNHIRYVENFLRQEQYADSAVELDVHHRLQIAKERLAFVSTPAYLKQLAGTIGADPFHKQTRVPGREDMIMATQK